MDRPMRTTTCPPGISNATLKSALGSYEAVLRGGTDYFVGALSRRASASELRGDLLDWLRTSTRRNPPQWATAHTIVAEWPIARLRDFSEAGAPESVPTLFLPPQAGHDSCIVDFAQEQSQVRTALEAGLTHVLSLDWVGATQSTKDATVEDYIAVIVEAITQLGGRVNLVGDCQGGWLAVIYAALHPDTVETLTIAGAPVDFHAGEPLIHDWMRLLAPRSDLTFYRALVNWNNGVLPGKVLLGGFIAMQPDNELDRQLQLLTHIHEPGHVDRYLLFEDWFKHTQAIPGAFYLWIVEHLFQNNELTAGTLRVGDRTVALGDIACPIHLLAGEADHITPPAQVFALADHVSTPVEQIDQRLAAGGHLGLFMGRDSLQHQWKPLFEELAAPTA
jgi:poly(3-hydroxybutyrate) depolymerase